MNTSLKFDGKLKGQTTGHFEYEKKCVDPVTHTSMVICKVVVDNEISFSSDLLNIDLATGVKSKHEYIPTPRGSVWGVCNGSTKYIELSTGELLHTLTFSAPILYGPTDYGISSNGKISVTNNFENITTDFSINDLTTKQCKGTLSGENITLTKNDTGIYTFNHTGLVQDSDGYNQYHWSITLVNPDINVPINSSKLIDASKVDSDVLFTFQASEEPTKNRAPIVRIEVKPSLKVESGNTVTLDGSKSEDPDPGGRLVSFSWTQVDTGGTGPSVVLSDPTKPIVTFEAPDVDEETVLTFSLKVTDSFPESTTKTIGVTIVPDIKIKGNVGIDTSDRNIVNIGGIRVEICSNTKVQLFCGDSPRNLDYTDSFGNFEIDLPNPTDITIKDISHIRISLINEGNSLLATHSDKTPPRQPAVIIINKPDFIQDSHGDYNTRLIFSSTEASTNGKIIDPFNIQTNNIPVNTISNLLSLFHYTNKAIEFTDNQLIKLQLGLPLEIKAFIDKKVSNFNKAPFPQLLLTIKNSNLNEGDKNVIARNFLILFHEFGHFVKYETTGSEAATNKNINRGVAADYTIFPQCHLGYINIDSSCSLSEGSATFFAFLIKDNIFNDFQHFFYKLFTLINPQSTTDQRDIEEQKHIVGNPTTKRGIFQWDKLAEEYAFASLLWDLYDTKSKELEDISISPNLIVRNVFESNTIDEFYHRIVNNPVGMKQLNNLFADFGICVDIKNKKGFGVCQPNEVNGKTAWKFIYSDPDRVYEYKLPGRK